MVSFKILDHPADIGIEVYGKDLEELFKNAAIGTTSLITKIGSLSSFIKKEITINGTDLTELFTRYLDEIIYLFDTEGFLIKEITNVETLHATSCQAIFTGEKFNKEKHTIKLYLKAVTYHQLEIKKENNTWKAKVYFDV